MYDQSFICTLDMINQSIQSNPDCCYISRSCCLLSSFQCLCWPCCLRRCWPGGRVSGPVRRPAPAPRRRAAACSVTAPPWLSSPKSFPARPPPSTWRRTDSGSCQKEPSVLCPHSSLFPWTTTTSLSLPLEPSRSAQWCVQRFYSVIIEGILRPWRFCEHIFCICSGNYIQKAASLALVYSDGRFIWGPT